MTIQRHHAIATVEPVHTAPAHEQLSASGRDLLACVRACGRRGAPAAAAGHALLEYWKFVACARVEERSALSAELRDDVAAGRTMSRAWLPVALGDPQFEVVREATRGYVGSWPASVQRRADAVGDVIDWIVRELGFNRAAVFCALLDVADAALLERLATLRGRLSPAETRVILAAGDASTDAERRAFIEEWRALEA